MGRLVAAAQHYRSTLGGLAFAQRHGQPTPPGRATLVAIQRARAALWAALAPFDAADTGRRREPPC